MPGWFEYTARGVCHRVAAWDSDSWLAGSDPAWKSVRSGLASGVGHAFASRLSATVASRESRWSRSFALGVDQ